MRIEILHLQGEEGAVDMMISPTREKAVRALRESRYERVAVVDTDKAREQYLCGEVSNLDVAWVASNNIDVPPWYTQPCIEELKHKWARSSMVGDIFMAGDLPFVVDRVGFIPLVEGAKII